MRSSSKAKKTYLQAVQNVQISGRPPRMIKEVEPTIIFTNENARQLHHPHDDAIVITLTIADYTTKTVLIDNGSSTDILYYLAFQQMRINKKLLQPVSVPLIEFGGMKVLPIGIISLPIVVGSYPQQINKEVNLLIVDCSSLYNAIIGRPNLNSWKATMSTYYLSVKFPTEYVIEEVQGDQLTTRECYLAMLAMDEQIQTMNIEERRTSAEPIEVLEDLPLDESNPKRFTGIGTNMGEKTKQDLVGFLKKSTDVFACSHEDMSGIDPSVITHHLNVSLSYKSVHQKKRVFAPRTR